ncbi:MAG: SOS response-associated peptidase family protein, partial [Planctomycetota bacterium]
DGKQPYLIEHRDGKMLAMAGLWERNRKLGQSQEEPLESCTIVTTSSNQTTRAVHDRMPVFLDEDGRDEWLSPKTSQKRLFELLRPADDDLLKLTPVSRSVGNPRNDGPQCVEPVEVSPSDDTMLF